jgi:hypothetical protein
MRRLGVLAMLCGCHTAEPALVGDSGVGDAMPGAPPEAALAEAPDAPDAPDARASLRAIADGGAPRRFRYDATSVLMCQTHDTWRPPAGFAVAQRGGDVVAYQEHALVGVVRVPHSKRAFEAAAARYVEGEVAWGAPTIERIDAWHAVVTALGTAPGLAVSARVVYPGVDADGSGRAGSDLQGNPGDLVWLAVAETPEKADALVTDARASRRVLVDHACECGYDCDRRPAR